MRVLIARPLLEQIRAECDAAWPNEACGLLLGEGGRILDVLPTPNVAADPRSRFEVAPEPLLAAHRAARQGGLQVLGSFHSHPSGKTRPSVHDAEQAAPDGSLWLIVAGPLHALWRTAPEATVHGRFDYVALRIAPASACQPAPGTAKEPSPIPPPQALEQSSLPIDPLDFASLLCSRLCHDLLSPVGAINNGLELLADEDDPEMRQRCLELLAESARTSAAKLKFFRLAFGAAGGFGETVDPRDAKTALEGLFGDSGKIALNWMVDEQPLPKPALKVLLNLALIAGDALIRGGRLDIGAESHGQMLEIVIRAEGQRLVLDPELKATLAGEAEDAPITPRAAAAYLVRALVQSGGGQVQVMGPEEGVLVLGAAMGLEPTSTPI